MIAFFIFVICSSCVITSLLYRLGNCAEKSAACPSPSLSLWNRTASALDVTVNDCSTSETLCHRSGGDWGIKRAGRKQAARGIGQSARLNTAQPYARRHGGAGQAYSALPGYFNDSAGSHSNRYSSPLQSTF